MNKIFSNASLKAKLMIGTGIIMLFVFVINSYNYYSIGKMNDKLNTTLNTNLELLLLDEDISENMVEQSENFQSYLLTDDNKERKAFETSLSDSVALEKEIDQKIKDEKALELMSKREKWEDLAQEILKEVDAGNKEKALEILDTEVKPLKKELINGLNELTSLREKNIQQASDEILEQANDMKTTSLILCISLLIIGFIIVYFSASLIVRSIKRVIAQMKALEQGDLTIQPLVINSKDEIGQLSSSINELQSTFKHVLSDVSTLSANVASNSEELMQSSNEVAEGAGMVSTTMHELAAGAEQQATSAAELAEMTNILTQKVESASQDGLEIESSSQSVLEMTHTGEELMDSSSRQMRNIDEVVDSVSQKLKTLYNKSQDISKLVVVIKNVADQTNLLSLNASIEAARAGEAGRGFAVVANEVKQLAGQTALSVKDITSIVADIHTQFDEVLKTLEQGSGEVKKGKVQIEETHDTFITIKESVEDMVNRIQSVSQSLSEISISNVEMNHFVQEIAAISEESSAGIEETSATTEQATSSMAEISRNIEDLSNMADQLHSEVSHFKI